MNGRLSISGMLLLFIFSLTAMLSGCGGGGGGGSSSSAAAGTTAAKVQLLVGSPQLDSAGTGTIDVTAVVLNSSNVAVANKTLTFQVSDPTGSTAYLNNVSDTKTDDNGVVTAKLNLGTNKANRTLTLTASADGASGSNTVEVINTKLTISGSSSVTLGASTPLVITLKDSAGTAISSASVSISSANGNSLSPSTGTTNSSGQVTVNVTGTVGGTDTITATSFGATATQTISVSNSTFNFTAPASGTEILVNSAQPLDVYYAVNGVPQSGQTINFSATRGTIAGSCVTNTSGNCTAQPTVSSTSTGTSIITAAAPGGIPSNTLSVTFTTASASNISAQTSRATVPVNTASSSTNRATISAVVRDAANNLVKNATVTFSLSDTTGGYLSVGSALTDISGTATVDYIAGTISSALNGVTVTARVTHVGSAAVTVNPSSVNLTVGGQSLFVRLGTDNLVTASSDGIKYIKNYTALVTDAAGNAVSGATVVFSLKPRKFVTASDYAYYKGSLSWSGSYWAPVKTASCYNEDSNFNGILDAGEDSNGNGILTPGAIAVVTGSATTDSSGFANAAITYAKDFANWESVTLQATASVAGTESTNQVSFDLLGLASDFSNQDTRPPGYYSPFGTGAVCTDTN